LFIVINETLQHVRFEFDLFRLAMKLNSGDCSLSAHDRAADVNQIAATLENLRVTVARIAPIPAQVLKRTSDPI